MLLCVTMAIAIDDARWVLGRSQYLDLLWVAAIGGVAGRLHRPEGRLGPLAHLPRRGDLRRPDRAAHHGHGGLPERSVDPRPLPGHLGFGVRCLLRHRGPRPAVDDPVPALRLHLRDPRVGDLDVRVVCGLRPSPAGQCRDRGRRRPAREHGPDRERRAGVPGPVQPGGALPAIRAHVFDEQSEWLRRRIGDPASISSVYLRGGSIFIVVGGRRAHVCSPRRPHPRRWRARSTASRTASSASRARSSASCRPAATTRAIGLAFGPNAQVRRVWNTDSVDRPDHPPRPDGQDALLLAGASPTTRST